MRRIRLPLLFSFVFACAGREPPPLEEPEATEEELPAEDESEPTAPPPPYEPGSMDGGGVPAGEPSPVVPPGEGPGESPADDEPPEESAKADPITELVGAYEYAGGKSSVNRSIENVVSQMNVMTRGIARRRLAANNRVPERVTIERDGEEIVVRLDSRTYKARPGRAKRVKNSDGGTSRMRYRVAKRKLRQIFEAEEGVRTNVFTPREDGGLDMTVTIASPRLPESVRYRISFKPT